jgi:hypothetical protein
MTSKTVAIRVGRLMEITVRDGFRSVEDVETQRVLINEAMAFLPANQPVVIAADWRACELMTQQAASALGPMIASFNTRIERSAILGAPNAPLAVLQFFRVARETRHPKRRVFDERQPMVDWLSECLSPAERQRLAQFLPT